MNVRNADASDAPIIAELHGQAWQEAFSGSPVGDAEDKWRAVLADDATTCLLAEADSPAAFIVTSMSEEGSRIDDLFVRPDYRRQGFGRRLVSAALDALPESGSCTLWVEDGNDAALRLYDSFGFERTGNARSDDRTQPPRQMLELALLPNSRQHRR